MLVHPIEYTYKRLRDSLMVPLARKPKDSIAITKVTEEDLHERDIRDNALKRELLEKQVFSKKRRRI